MCKEKHNIKPVLKTIGTCPTGQSAAKGAGLSFKYFTARQK
jgi:hypothetical protein